MKNRSFEGKKLWALFLILILITIVACGRGVSQQMTRPVEGSQSLSVADVTGMASQALQNMGYGIQEQNLDAGYLYASKRVLEDIYGRSVEIKINVAADPTGDKSLSVQAFTCPGCIPEAHFDPGWMANQFYSTFDLVANSATRSAKPSLPPAYDPSMAIPYQGPGDPNPAIGPQMSDAEQRNMLIVLADSQRKAQLGVTLQTVTPELASFLGLREPRGAIIQNVDPTGPADKAKLRKGDVILTLDEKPVNNPGDVILGIAGKSPGDKVTLLVSREGKTFNQLTTLAQRTQPSATESKESPDHPAPSIHIDQVKVNPAVVKSGSKFKFVTDYTVTDSAAREKEIPVKFAFIISEGSNTLYSPEAVEIQSVNGGNTKRTEPVAASRKKGTYTLKVILQYKDLQTEKSVAFRIE
jgi:hypothetical protein